MNNKLRDVDAFVISIWIALGTGLGIFLAPIFKANLLPAGSLGFLFGIVVIYVQFFRPLWQDRRRSRRMGRDLNNTEEEDEEEENEEQDKIAALNFIRKAIDAETVHIRSNFKPASSLGSAVIQKDEFEDDENDEDQEDVDMYLTDSEDGELEEEKSVDYSNSQFSSFFDQEDNYQPLHGFETRIASGQAILTSSLLWFVLSGIIVRNFPGFEKEISKYFPFYFFAFLPILFLVGLSGLMGIKLKQENETSEEKSSYFSDMAKIVLGWGLGIYLILSYLF